MDHYGILVQWTFIIIYLPYVITYNLKTVWCNIDDNLQGRCRLTDECYDERAQPNSNCSEDTICCPDSVKPNLLCQKYGASLYNQMEFITSLGFTYNTQERALSCANTDTPLIIGGEKAREKEFPYMAAIGFGKSRNTANWHCGGTLISSQYVLSAAHCAKSKPLRSEAKWVLLGAIKLSLTNENGRQIFDIVKRIKHPKYKPPSKEYDIILFKLSSPAIFTEYVRPACLNTDDTLDTLNVFATGWGVTSYSDANHSDVLMKVTLQMREFETCVEAYQNQSKTDLPHGILDSMLCVGSLKKGKDTCQGDSGGPITISLREPKCMYSIVGVTSFGMFCGFSTPAIYTRVSYFIPWILDEMTKL